MYENNDMIKKDIHEKEDIKNGNKSIYFKKVNNEIIR